MPGWHNKTPSQLGFVFLAENRINFLAGQYGLPAFLCMWGRASDRLSNPVDSRVLCLPQTEKASSNVLHTKGTLV